MDIHDFYTQFIHFGITPYIGDYGDIHTWLLIKIDHTPKFKETLLLLIFVFKDVHLKKLVQTLEKNIMFNYI